MDFIEKEAQNAFENGAEFILQKDSNAHLGADVVEGDPNSQNSNGKLFCDFEDSHWLLLGGIGPS